MHHSFYHTLRPSRHVQIPILSNPNTELVLPAHLDHGGPDSSTHKYSQTVEQKQPGDGSDKDEPEPEEDVDLLIDDIERKHTETIMSLNCSRRTIFVKSTFGNFGKTKARS